MKKGLEHIDEVFKQAFDGFEADVDPSVWSNIQHSISSGSGVNNSPKKNPVTANVGGKYAALKIVASIIVIGSITTGAYFVLDNNTKEDAKAIIAEISTKNIVLDTDEIVRIPTQNFQQKEDPIDLTNRKPKEKEMDLIPSPKKNKLTKKNAPPIVTNKVKGFENETEIVENEEQPKEIIRPTIEHKTSTTPTVKEEKVLSGMISASVTFGKAPLEVVFDAEGENMVSYLWVFGDNTENSSNQSVFHTYQEPGVYTVELTIIDENKNSKTFSQLIEVENNITSSLGLIPDLFTPNGDGLNDVYRLPSTENISLFNAKIQTLQGKAVYEWNSIEEGWNGRDVSGRMMDEGMYILTIYAKGTDGKEHRKPLVITLTK